MRHFINKMLREEKPERGQIGKHKVVLSDAGLVESTAVNESSTTWQGLDRIEQNTDYLFVYVGPIQAIIIPKRAFKDAAATEAFVEFIRTKKQAAG